MTLSVSESPCLPVLPLRRGDHPRAFAGALVKGRLAIGADDHGGAFACADDLRGLFGRRMGAGVILFTSALLLGQGVERRGARRGRVSRRRVGGGGRPALIGCLPRLRGVGLRLGKGYPLGRDGLFVGHGLPELDILGDEDGLVLLDGVGSEARGISLGEGSLKRPICGRVVGGGGLSLGQGLLEARDRGLLGRLDRLRVGVGRGSRAVEVCRDHAGDESQSTTSGTDRQRKNPFHDLYLMAKPSKNKLIHRGLTVADMPGRYATDRKLTFAAFRHGQWPPARWNIPAHLEGAELVMWIEERQEGQRRKCGIMNGKGQVTPAEAAKPTQTKIMDTTKSSTELAAVPCSDLVEVAASAMQTKVRDAHVIRINDGPWLDFEATHKLGKILGFGGYLNFLEWLVEKYGAPFKGVVNWPNASTVPTAD